MQILRASSLESCIITCQSCDRTYEFRAVVAQECLRENLPPPLYPTRSKQSASEFTNRAYLVRYMLSRINLQLNQLRVFAAEKPSLCWANQEFDRFKNMIADGLPASKALLLELERLCRQQHPLAWNDQKSHREGRPSLSMWSELWQVLVRYISGQGQSFHEGRHQRVVVELLGKKLLSLDSQFHRALETRDAVARRQARMDLLLSPRLLEHASPAIGGKLSSCYRPKSKFLLQLLYGTPLH